MGGLKNRQVKRGAERQRVARPAPALRFPGGLGASAAPEGLFVGFASPAKELCKQVLGPSLRRGVKEVDTTLVSNSRRFVSTAE